MKNSKLDETPYFFTVTVLDSVYKLAASTEEERSRWIVFIKNLAVNWKRVFALFRFVCIKTNISCLREPRNASPMRGWPLALWCSDVIQLLHELILLIVRLSAGKQLPRRGCKQVWAEQQREHYAAGKLTVSPLLSYRIIGLSDLSESAGGPEGGQAQ